MGATPSNMQIENVEVAQSKTASEIKELRNHHNQSRKRLEKLENDVEEVSLPLTGSAKMMYLTLCILSTVETRTRRDAGSRRVEAPEGGD